jgi:hypothetical protein
MRQASRRSWRIGQRRPVEVTYFVYEGTLQAEALALVAAKLRSSLMVEGELPEDGLATLGGDGQDHILALARTLTEQGTSAEASLEALFDRARAAETDADDLLVDGDWQYEAGPMPGPPSEASPPGDGTEEWQRVFASGPATNAAMPNDASAAPTARVMSFEELARRLRRPKPRRKAVPAEQLRLFGD